MSHHRWFFWHKLISWFFSFLSFSLFCVFPFCLLDSLLIWYSQNFLEDFFHFCKRCTSFHICEGMRNSEVFKSFIHLELKPEAIAPWKRTFSELCTVPIALLSRATCFRYGTYCITGYIYFFHNGGDSICTKAI